MSAFHVVHEGADQVKHQICEVSKVVFDVVAEDPQEEHVPSHV